MKRRNLLLLGACLWLVTLVLSACQNQLVVKLPTQGNAKVVVQDYNCIFKKGDTIFVRYQNGEWCINELPILKDTVISYGPSKVTYTKGIVERVN